VALVWIGLVLALLVTLALCTIMLVRKFVALLQSFADFVSLPAILDGVHRAEADARPTPAVLLPRAQAAARHAARGQRRAERRAARSQLRLARARALIRADVNALN
jgi:hypothetical protein